MGVCFCLAQQWRAGKAVMYTRDSAKVKTCAQPDFILPHIALHCDTHCTGHLSDWDSTACHRLVCSTPGGKIAAEMHTISFPL